MKKRIAAILFTLLMIVICTGCSESNNVGKNSDVKVITDNTLHVNRLTDHMTSFKTSESNSDILASVKTKVDVDTIDFSSLSNSSDTAHVGEVVYVQGIIPKKDYPPEKISIYTDSYEKAEHDNPTLTTDGEDTILNFEVIAKEPGVVNVYVGLDDSDVDHFFDLEIIEPEPKISEPEPEIVEEFSSEPETEPITKSAPAKTKSTVFTTPTGKKYHAYGCRYLRGNGIEISESDAKTRGLEPCTVCL